MPESTEGPQEISSGQVSLCSFSTEAVKWKNVQKFFITIGIAAIEDFYLDTGGFGRGPVLSMGATPEFAVTWGLGCPREENLFT